MSCCIPACGPPGASCSQRDSPDDEVRIKVLQTLPILVKPPAYSAPPLFVSQVFEVCFHMLHDKSPIIQNTAEATVRQVCAARWGRDGQLPA